MQTMLALLARQTLMLDRRNARIAAAHEAMQQIAQAQAIEQWNESRHRHGFDPMIAAASAELAVTRNWEWQQAKAAATRAVGQRDIAAEQLKLRLQREALAEQAVAEQSRKWDRAVVERDFVRAEDVLTHFAWGAGRIL